LGGNTGQGGNGLNEQHVEAKYLGQKQGHTLIKKKHKGGVRKGGKYAYNSHKKRLRTHEANVQLIDGKVEGKGKKPGLQRHRG